METAQGQVFLRYTKTYATNHFFFLGMIRLVSRERDDILAKYFYVYIRAAPLIIKYCTCDLDSNTHAILFLNDNDSAISIKTVSHCECQWIVRSTFCRCPCWWIRGSSSRFWCECCHSLIWAATKHALLKLHWHSRCETGIKRIQICIHAAADPERATQIVFSTTHHYFCVTDI